MISMLVCFLPVLGECLKISAIALMNIFSLLCLLGADAVVSASLTLLVSTRSTNSVLLPHKRFFKIAAVICDSSVWSLW